MVTKGRQKKKGGKPKKQLLGKDELKGKEPAEKADNNNASSSPLGKENEENNVQEFKKVNESSSQNENPDKTDQKGETSTQNDLDTGEEETEIEKNVESSPQVEEILQALAKKAMSDSRYGKNTSTWEKLFAQLAEIRLFSPEQRMEELSTAYKQELHAQAELTAKLELENQEIRESTSAKAIEKLKTENEKLKIAQVESSQEIRHLRHTLAGGSETDPNDPDALFPKPIDPEEYENLKKELALAQEQIENLKMREGLLSKFTGLQIQIPVCGRPRYTCYAKCQKRKRTIKYEIEKEADEDWHFVPLKGNYFPNGLKEEIVVPPVQLPELFVFMMHGLFYDPDEDESDSNNQQAESPIMERRSIGQQVENPIKKRRTIGQQA